MENSGASYRNFLIGIPFQEASKLARHQMFVTSYKELQSKPFRCKVFLRVHLWSAGCSLIKLSLEERRPRDLHPFQPYESEEVFTVFIDHGAGTVVFAHSRR